MSELRWVQYTVDGKPMWSRANHETKTMHTRHVEPPPLGLNRQERRKWEAKRRAEDK